jgi:uncharacterized membrane protein (Fun14 family)
VLREYDRVNQGRTEMSDSNSGAKKSGLSKFQTIALVSLVVLLIASVAARAMYLSTHEAKTSSGASSTLQPNSYLTKSERSAEPSSTHDQGAVEKSLPYITEGSLFGLIGFALGYATRKIFKLALFAIALVFIAIQALTYFKVMNVEWGPVITWLNEALLNLKQNESITEFFTKRVPSIGAMGVGYLLGFKRG